MKPNHIDDASSIHDKNVWQRTLKDIYAQTGTIANLRKMVQPHRPHDVLLRDAIAVCVCDSLSKSQHSGFTSLDRRREPRAVLSPKVFGEHSVGPELNHAHGRIIMSDWVTINLLVVVRFPY